MVASAAEMWSLLQRELREPTTIRNWTRDSGYLRGDFVAHAKPHTVACLLPKGTTVYVPRTDFERVYGIWNQYCAGEIPRHYLRDEVTRHSKYIITILYQFLRAV